MVRGNFSPRCRNGYQPYTHTLFFSTPETGRGVLEAAPHFHGAVCVQHFEAGEEEHPDSYLPGDVAWVDFIHDLILWLG